jgi:hypothetical protein
MINLKDYGIDVGLLVSGLFGSILLTSKDSARNLGKTVSSLIGGAASANYITPIVISITKMDDTHYHYGIAFLLGFLGLKGIEFFSNKLIPENLEIYSQSNRSQSVKKEETQPEPEAKKVTPRKRTTKKKIK